MMAKARTMSSRTTGAKHFVKYLKTSYFQRLNMVAISIPIGIVGLIANVVVLFLYCCKIKKPKLGTYFLSMMFANIFIILCNFEMAAYILGGVEIPIAFQHLLEILHIFSYDANLYVTTFLAADRFLIVYFPVWWELHRTKHFTAMICMVMWSISGLESLLEYFSCYTMENSWAYDTCRTASVVALIIEVSTFSTCMFCLTLAIWLRTEKPQEKHRARLDITVVAIAIIILSFTVPVRIVNIISLWVSSIDYDMFSSISLLLDSCASSSIPLVFLIVGSWNKPKSPHTLGWFLERALQDAEETPKPTKDQEQA